MTIKFNGKLASSHEIGWQDACVEQFCKRRSKGEAQERAFRIPEQNARVALHNSDVVKAAYFGGL